MKKILSLLLISCATIVQAQNYAEWVHIGEFIPVKHTDPIAWIKRYQTDIDRYADENRQLNDFSCDALFLGSSSINLWKNIYNDMAPLKIIRRSYGGATIRDMLYNYNVIARGYKPKNIVVYVENDLCGCKEDITPGDTYDLFRIFILQLQKDYPDVPLYILSFKPSQARAAQRSSQQMVNALLKDFCRKTENVNYVDITTVMYDANGLLKTDIFEPDNLHINQKGYDLWTSILKPLLINR